MTEIPTVRFIGGPWDGKETAFEKLHSVLIIRDERREYEYKLEVWGTVANVRRMYIYQGERSVTKVEEAA